MSVRCLDCPALIPRGKSRCGACSRTHEAKRMARRAPSGWELQRMNRATIAANNGRCAECPEPAVEVDHALPLHREGPNTETNRIPLCRTHHLAKTRRDRAMK